MTGLFQVVYFDPAQRAPRMMSYTVTAANGEEAIRKANRMKEVKSYRVEEVKCLGFSDE